MTEVAVTGIGVVCPLGNDVETFGRRLFAGESGVRSLRGGRVPADFPVPYAGLVERAALDRPEGAAEPSSYSRLYSTATAEEALAALPRGHAVDAVVFGTAECLDFPVVRESFRRDPRRDDSGFPWDDALPEGPLDAIAEILERRGHGGSGLPAPPPARRIAVTSACASGSQAIGVACHRIRQGLWQRAVAGGVDSRLHMANLMSFHMLSALMAEDCPPETASRPFSIDRGGFVRAEGAAALLLESREAAEARGAEILALVTGYAHTSDAWHFTEGRPDGASVIAAMRGAISDAGLEPGAIDAVSAHGTSTPLNDRLETAAVKEVFGGRAYEVPVTALKSQIGHTVMAAGAVAAVSCVLQLREQRLAPTINYREDEVDPDCDLDYVPNRSRPARLRRMLANSFGFGGHNACLVVEGAGERE